jgi:hypothetical protein
MNLIVSTIPEDPAAQAVWLERQIVGLELDRLVAELSAVHGMPAALLSVETVLAGYLDHIHNAGLSGLPRDLLRNLLIQPALLLQLQEQILLHGGPYWDDRARDNADVAAVVERGRVALPGQKRTLSSPWYFQPWVLSLATAALVLVAVGLWIVQRPAAPVSTAWGWDRPGALPEQASSAAYLNALADAAGDWFAKRPATPPALARRIGQFRQGCSTLILAPHTPLKEADRKWLVERCRAWSGKFDRYLTDLEAGKDVIAVRDEMDATVEQLVKALRQRSQHAA